MSEIELCEEILPFVCGNPECQKKYDLNLFTEVALLWGFIYLVSEDDETAIIGMTCPDCTKTTLRKYTADTAILLHTKLNKEALRCGQPKGPFGRPSFDICIYFSSTLLKDAKFISHTFPQDIKDGEPHYTVPEILQWSRFSSCLKYPHYVIPESILPYMCDIENNHRYKAIPRVVDTQSSYLPFDCIWSDEGFNAKNETLVQYLVKPTSHRDTSSTKYEHMVLNDLSDEEFDTLGLDLLGFQRQEFIDNIESLLEEGWDVRNRIDFEIIFRNELINKYARKMYFGPGPGTIIPEETYGENVPEWAYLQPTSPAHEQTLDVKSPSETEMQREGQISIKEDAVKQDQTTQTHHLNAFMEEKNRAELQDVENAFSRQGGIWIIKFKGNMASIKAIKRVLYVAYLIGNPGTSIDNLKLTNMVRESTGIKAKNKVKKISEKEPDKYRHKTTTDEEKVLEYAVSSQSLTIVDTLDMGEDLDKIKQAEEILKNKGNILLRKLEKAEKISDDKLIEDIGNEIEKLVKTCEKYGGKPKVKKDEKDLYFYPNLIKITKEQEKARKNIDGNIKNTLKEIKTVMPELSQYLRTHIKQRMTHTVFLPSIGNTDKALKWEVFL